MVEELLSQQYSNSLRCGLWKDEGERYVDYGRTRERGEDMVGGVLLRWRWAVVDGVKVILGWGNTPLDEGQVCGNKNLIKLLEDAKSAQTSQFPECSNEVIDKKLLGKRKCTVFSFPLWKSKEIKKPGVVMWIPRTIDELINIAAEKLDFPNGSCILSEDGGKILDVDMIDNGQKLYLFNATEEM
ncbi:hypothetical protein Ancab_005636 [Ancistrocladus abbreviatus]